MRYLHLLVLTFVICWTIAPRPSAGTQIEIQFEDLVAGTTYPNGSLPVFLASESGSFALSEFGGGSSANGFVGTDNLAGSTGNELELYADLRAEFNVGLGAIEASLNFARFGGTNLLEINGATVALSEVILLGPGSVGGVSYSAGTVGGNAYNVQLDGLISSFAVVGQELAIDNVRMTIVPEPSSIGLSTVGLIGLALAWRRKRRR